MTENKTCIQIENLVKTYGRTRIRALDEISLNISQGEIFGLIGPNGAGKTTLMGCMLSLLHPTSGSIKIFGETPDSLIVKNRSAFLPERPNFDAWMTARQFMHYHHMLAKRPGNLAKEDIDEALRIVELDESAWDKRIKKFSRGMLQRLGLAQMLLGKPELCFLDEPGSGMDPLGTNLLRSLLIAWKDKGTTVVLNSHHLDELERVCDRVAFIKSGKILKVETITNITKEQLVIIVRCAAKEKTMAEEELKILAEEISCTFLSQENNVLRFKLKNNSDKVKLVKTLVAKSIPVEEIFQERRVLEDLFITIHGERRGERRKNSRKEV